MFNFENIFKTAIDPLQVNQFLDNEYHENFGKQWNRFNKLQLDSFNGSSESSDRILNQSELDEDFFKNKAVLEVGAGNGRFTEKLLNWGAKVVAVDFSSAISANFENHKSFVKNGSLICVRGDIFNLPITEEVFDVVFCYGVIQHTGDNLKCINQLSKYVKPGGDLLIDIYSNSFKHFNPWIYLIRPFFGLLRDEDKKIRIVESFVNFVFPFQLRLLGFLHKKGGLFKILRFFLNRSPNSVYGVNLYLDSKISLENAKNWSICDTYDAWSPKHDHPVSFKKWTFLLDTLENFETRVNKSCGQGWCARLVKKISN